MAWRIPVTIASTKNLDFVFGFWEVALVSFLELWLGLIVACLPTLAPLSNKYIKPYIARLTQRASSKGATFDEIRMERGPGGAASRKTTYNKLGGKGSQLGDGEHTIGLAKSYAHTSTTSASQHPSVLNSLYGDTNNNGNDDHDTTRNTYPIRMDQSIQVEYDDM